MIFIRNILHTTKKDLYYQWCSKKGFLVFAILLALSITHLIGLHNDVFSAYNRYKTTESTYIENGIDVIEALEAPNNSFVDGNSRVIDNPLKEDFISLSLSIQNLKPQNIIGNTLEYMVFVFCTLLFGIYASYVATYDFQYKTYKFISIRNSQKDILLGKLLSTVIVMVTTLTAALLFVFLGSFFINTIVANQIPVENYEIAIFNYESGLVPQVILSLLVICFYIIVGYSTAYLLKSMVIPTIGLLLYGLLVPILGAYDFRNIFSYFSHKIFSFTARFVMFQAKPINEVLGIIFPVVTVAVLLALVFSISKKRSAYS